nr:fibroleukin-like [Crassostrea gigas]
MRSSEMGSKFVLSLLNIILYFLGNTLGYTPETNLGKCFEGTSEGYILLFDRSFVDCVRECKRRPRCQALRYDRRVLICMLYPTDQIPKRDISGCYQAFRWEFIHQFALEGKCEEHHTKCNLNETCSLNTTTMEPFCEILDCAERPSRFAPNTEMVHYVDSRVGARAKIQCKSFIESSGGTKCAVCTEQGEWKMDIQCKVPESILKDCTELFSKNNTLKSGHYNISPDRKVVKSAYCNMETEEGWTVVQRRIRKDGSLNFTRKWRDYKAGFGEATGNYWIGNDALHALTKSANTLRIQLTTFNGSTVQAEYSNLSVSDESANYAMTYGKYVKGSAGDALGGTGLQFRAKDMSFSTVDKDNDQYNDGSCARKMRGGWWYNKCSTSNLNGKNCEDGESCMTWQKTGNKPFPGHQDSVIMISTKNSNING